MNRIGIVIHGRGGGYEEDDDDDDYIYETSMFRSSARGWEVGAQGKGGSRQIMTTKDARYNNTHLIHRLAINRPLSIVDDQIEIPPHWIVT